MSVKDDMTLEHNIYLLYYQKYHRISLLYSLGVVSFSMQIYHIQVVELIYILIHMVIMFKHQTSNLHLSFSFPLPYWASIQEPRSQGLQIHCGCYSIVYRSKVPTDMQQHQAEAAVDCLLYSSTQTYFVRSKPTNCHPHWYREVINHWACLYRTPFQHTSQGHQSIL